MNAKLDSIKETSQYSINEVAELTGLDTMYVRKAVRDGKLTSRMVSVGDTKVQKHMIKGSDILTWRASAGSHTTRADGRNKYTVYMTKEELAKIEPALKAAGIPYALSNAGEYERRKAQKEADVAAIKASIATPKVAPAPAAK